MLVGKLETIYKQPHESTFCNISPVGESRWETEIPLNKTRGFGAIFCSQFEWLPRVLMELSSVIFRL